MRFIVFIIRRLFWDKEIRRIKNFYASCFGRAISFNKVSLPPKNREWTRLGYVIADLTVDEIIQAYKKCFDEKSLLMFVRTLQEKQMRPSGDYAYCRRNMPAPDSDQANKGHELFSAEGKQYLALKEGLLDAFRFRFEHGVVWDHARTYFCTLTSAGHVLYMREYGPGQLCVSCDLRPESGGFCEIKTR